MSAQYLLCLERVVDSVMKLGTEYSIKQDDGGGEVECDISILDPALKLTENGYAFALVWTNGNRKVVQDVFSPCKKDDLVKYERHFNEKIWGKEEFKQMFSDFTEGCVQKKSIHEWSVVIHKKDSIEHLTDPETRELFFFITGVTFQDTDKSKSKPESVIDDPYEGKIVVYEDTIPAGNVGIYFTVKWTKGSTVLFQTLYHPMRKENIPGFLRIFKFQTDLQKELLKISSKFCKEHITDENYSTWKSIIRYSKDERYGSNPANLGMTFIITGFKKE